MRRTKIEWTDATWNPVRGCSRVSEGCRNCYAERQAGRFAIKTDPADSLLSIEVGPFARFVRRVHGRAQWTGKVELIESKLMEPLRWREPKKIFVNSMSDLFHEALPDEAIDRVFAVMALCPQHTFQVLTKRPERMLEYFTQETSPYFYPCYRVEKLAGSIARGRGMNMAMLSADWPLPNVWLGVSVEDQKTADERIPLLLQTPAAVRFVSYEPALGPIDFSLIKMDMAEVTHDLIAWHQKRGDVVTRESYENYPQVLPINSLTGYSPARAFPALDWLICGGESGHGARPMRAGWARSVRDQCEEANVAYFFKQWGEWLPESQDNGYGRDHMHKFGEGEMSFKVGKKAAGRLLDGVAWDEFPGVRA